MTEFGDNRKLEGGCQNRGKNIFHCHSLFHHLGQSSAVSTTRSAGPTSSDAAAVLTRG